MEIDDWRQTKHMIISTTIIIAISCQYHYKNMFYDFAFSCWPTAITVNDISHVTGHF